MKKKELIHAYMYVCGCIGSGVCLGWEMGNYCVPVNKGDDVLLRPRVEKPVLG